MAERPRELGDFKGMGHFEAKLVTIRANIYGSLGGEWLYYNFAAGSFHTKKLCSRLYSIKIEFNF